MQTHEWEALLDGTADGPWEAERHGNEPVISIRTTAHDPKRYVGDIYGEWNAHLAAHAPAAVAEVVRLRREVSEFRDQMTESAEQYEALDHLMAAEYDRQIADALTRILEGDADE